MFYGSFIARFFGVLLVWFVRIFYSLIKGGKIKSFKEIWNIPNYDDLANKASYEMKFIVIGVIFIFIICWFLMKIHF